jgi:DNA topoisomerase-2
MYLIGPNGAVKKYASPEEILVDYIDVRLKVFKNRKAWLLKEFDSEIEWLSEKARFITGVIRGNIRVMNTLLIDIQNQLKAAKFDEAIWVKLMDIKTYQYTKEEVDKLTALIAKRTHDRQVLKGTSVVDLWKNNLSQL